MSTQARRPKQGQGGGHQAGEGQRPRRCPGPNPAPSSLTSPCPRGEQGPEDTHTDTHTDTQTHTPLPALQATGVPGGLGAGRSAPGLSSASGGVPNPLPPMDRRRQDHLPTGVPMPLRPRFPHL